MTHCVNFCSGGARTAKTKKADKTKKKGKKDKKGRYLSGSRTGGLGLHAYVWTAAAMATVAGFTVLAIVWEHGKRRPRSAPSTKDYAMLPGDIHLADPSSPGGSQEDDGHSDTIEIEGYSISRD